MRCNYILIIEDEPDLRDSLKDLLELYGFQTQTAAHGLEGLKRLEENGKSCLILLDLMMPVMNGWEFLEALKLDEPPGRTMPVAVVSAAADVVEVGKKYGCDVLKKPIDIDRLVTLARQYC